MGPLVLFSSDAVGYAGHAPSAANRVPIPPDAVTLRTPVEKVACMYDLAFRRRRMNDTSPPSFHILVGKLCPHTHANSLGVPQKKAILAGVHTACTEDAAIFTFSRDRNQDKSKTSAMMADFATLVHLYVALLMQSWYAVLSTDSFDTAQYSLRIRKLASLLERHTKKRLTARRCEYHVEDGGWYVVTSFSRYYMLT